MNVHHTLICFFFLSLQDGNTENTKFLYTGVIGGDVRVGHAFQSSGTLKMFCKEKCEGGNILIKTTDVRAQSGRYSIEYEYDHKTTFHVLSVSITKLTQSDAGLYSCGLGGSLSSDSYIPFTLLVVEALLDGNHDPSQQKHFYKETGSSLTVGCSFKLSGSRKMFCRGECGGDKLLVDTDDVRAQRGRYSIGYVSGYVPGFLHVTITQLTTSDSGRYRCYLDKSSFREFEITVTDDVLLYVGLTLPVTIILISVAVLIFCKKRSSKAKDLPVKTEYAVVMKTNNTDITDEDRQSRSPPVGISPVSRHLHTKYTKPSGAEANDSLVTAATPHCKNVHYENWTPVSMCEESRYQRLNPASRDLDQSYSTLEHHT